MRRIDNSNRPQSVFAKTDVPAKPVKSAPADGVARGRRTGTLSLPVKVSAPAAEHVTQSENIAEAFVALGSVKLMAGEQLPDSNLVVMRTKGVPFDGVVTGHLKRGTNKKGEVEALFVPDERTMKPFVLSPYDAQGIASNGRVTLVGGLHGIAIDTKATESVTSMVGRVEREGAQFFITGLDKFAPMQRVPLEGGTAELVGKTVLAHVVDGFSQNRKAQVRSAFESYDTWKVAFTDLAVRNGVEATFSDEVRAELATLKTKFNPDKIEGYVDMTDKPFITIDNPYSKDYDQAMYIEPSPTEKGAHDVYYAIADTSYFFKLLGGKNSAVAERSKRLQTTTYMPGLDAPILDRLMSEDLVSLIPNAKRPAFVFKYTVSADGKVLGEPTFIDAVIKSRGATNYGAAQDYIDGKTQVDPMLATAFDRLKVVGGALLVQAKARKMVRGQGGERWGTIDPKTHDLVLETRGMRWIEEANAQISITANAIAGEYLVKNNAPAYHRVHGEPDERRIELARQSVKELGVDWPEELSPSEMLLELDPAQPGYRALQILVLRSQPRAIVSGEPASHAGLKLLHYDQMTAPMRRDRDGRNHTFLRAVRDGREQDVSEVEEVLQYAQLAQDRAARLNREMDNRVSAKALEPFSGKVLKAEVISVSMRGFEVYFPELEVERFIPMPGQNQLDAHNTVLHAKGDSPLSVRLTDVIDVRIDSVSALEGKARLVPLGAAPLQKVDRVRGRAEGVSFDQVRGDGFRSKLVGKQVTTEGVVTTINEVGFYIQPEGGNAGGLLVRTRDARVALGDHVRVSGTVRELADKGNAFGRTVVEITERPRVERLGAGEAPAAIDLSAIGQPPSDYVGATDYWRKLLGTRVRIPSASTLSAMNRFGDLVVLPDTWTIPADRRSQYGGVLYQEGLDNTVKAGIKYRDRLGVPPPLSMGAKLEGIEGVVTYRSGDFQIELTDKPKVASNPKVESEVTSFEQSATAFTFASINILNGNPSEVERLRASARRIVHHMKSPSVLTLQEVQDNDGPKVSDVVAADKTYELICKLIREEGGPDYGYIDVPPRNGEDGGEPGGNIRNGYLYRKDRMQLIQGSVQRIGEGTEAFKDSRKSVVAGFRFNGKSFYFVNTHHKSMLGSTPWTGEQQPPIIGGEEQRLAQSKLEREWIDRAIKNDPTAEWITLGDRNATPGAASVVELTKTGFVNMAMTVPAEKRFDYNYRGNLQSLCSIVVSPKIAKMMRIEYLHGNSVNPIDDSDHDHVMGIVETK